jgi:hypothetical protein
MTLINLDRLKDSPEDRDLYFVATRASGWKSGVVDIDISELKVGPELRLRLAQARSSSEN